VKYLRYWLLGLAALGIVLAAYLAGSRGSKLPANLTATSAETPAYDFEATGVVMRQMNAEGTLLYRLDAKRVAQLPQNGALAASDLQMNYAPPGTDTDSSKHWQLTADAAELPTSGSIVNLRGNVLVTGKPERSRDAAQLKTDTLDYNLTTQDLSTRSRVELRWGHSRLTGQGLKANIKQGTVAIESTVNGTLAH
jgi:LPS export ABC transporter protein LptC